MVPFPPLSIRIHTNPIYNSQGVQTKSIHNHRVSTILLLRFSVMYSSIFSWPVGGGG